MIPIIDAVVKAGAKVLDKIVMDKEQKMRLQNDFELEIRKMATTEETELRKFFLEYEGKLADIPRPIQYLRASVRPVLTYIICGAYVWGFVHPTIWKPAEMAVLNPAVLIVLAFWFGEKILTRTGLVDALRKK